MDGGIYVALAYLDTAINAPVDCRIIRQKKGKYKSFNSGALCKFSSRDRVMDTSLHFILM